MKAAELNLAPTAQAAADALEAAIPGVVFTSGRRDVKEQAHAMASNIVHNSYWIEQTYHATPASLALQKWVNAHHYLAAVDDIAAGLAGVMATWDEAWKAMLSKHFSGQAFDVQPVGGHIGAAILAAIPKLPGVTKFLTHEGGLIRWHVETAP